MKARYRGSKKAHRMRALVDSALPQNSFSQNWGSQISAYAGRIGSGYIGPAIMGEDVATRMYQHIMGVSGPIPGGAINHPRYIKVPVIQSNTELRNNSQDKAHVEVSFWKLRKNIHVWRQWENMIPEQDPPRDRISPLDAAPRTNSPLDWFRWDLNKRQTAAFDLAAPRSVQDSWVHLDFAASNNFDGTASGVPAPPKLDDTSGLLLQHLVEPPISDQLGVSMFSAKNFNKFFKCVRMAKKTMDVGQIWNINYKSKSSFNSRHITQMQTYRGQQEYDNNDPELPDQTLNTNSRMALPGMTFMVCRTWGVPGMTASGLAANNANGPHMSVSTTTEVTLSAVTTQKYFFQEVKHVERDEEHHHLNFVPFGYAENPGSGAIILQNLNKYNLVPLQGQHTTRILVGNSVNAQNPFNVAHEVIAGTLTNEPPDGPVGDNGFADSHAAVYP